LLGLDVNFLESTTACWKASLWGGAILRLVVVGVLTVCLTVETLVPCSGFVPKKEVMYREMLLLRRGPFVGSLAGSNQARRGVPSLPLWRGRLSPGLERHCSTRQVRHVSRST
jgi:hypothetical protein